MAATRGRGAADCTINIGFEVKVKATDFGADWARDTYGDLWDTTFCVGKVVEISRNGARFHVQFPGDPQTYKWPKKYILEHAAHQDDEDDVPDLVDTEDESDEPEEAAGDPDSDADPTYVNLSGERAAPPQPEIAAAGDGDPGPERWARAWPASTHRS
eukprot:jgi/Mesvir1/6050/Mv00785-RA.1